ncbi:MAG: hypothetical protein C4329_10295 [Chitinophagaceae bacterium]
MMYCKFLILALFATSFSFAQIKTTAPPTLNVIKEADLKRDLYAMANDHFRGREAGTLDELKVSMW